MLQAGAQVLALVEAAPAIGGYQEHARKLEKAAVPILLQHTVIEARGDTHVKEAVIAELDRDFKPIAGTKNLAS